MVSGLFWSFFGFREYFGHSLGFGDILVNFWGSGVFGSFFRFRGILVIFWVSGGILVIFLVRKHFRHFLVSGVFW